MIKIDKGIPMPKESFGRPRGTCIYPWNEMEIGDSFFLENPPRQKNGQIVPMCSAPNKRYAPKRFALRKDGTGVRIWRIE